MSHDVSQLLISVDTRLLTLTPIDDDIYHKFRVEFPELAVSKVDESSLKSEDTKAVSVTYLLISVYIQYIPANLANKILFYMFYTYKYIYCAIFMGPKFYERCYQIFSSLKLSQYATDHN